jgi:sulfoxide reductase heme-binding subunit YedZ
LLAVIHFVWLVKSDVREPLAYGAVVLLLLALRLKTIRRALVDLRERLATRRRGYSRVALPKDLS